MDLGEMAFSLDAQDTAPALNLRTGYFDDRRKELHRDDERYVVFSHAYRQQDGWDDAQHREFWMTHLALWPSSGRQRPNREALAFVLGTGRLDEGFATQEVVEAMPGRSWADLRDRGIVNMAERMAQEVTTPRSPPDMPSPSECCDGSTLIPGPAHPDVVAAMQRWRLPRVWADSDDGGEEKALPPPLAGYINLPDCFGDYRAFSAIGDASFEAIEQGCAALSELRRRRGRQRAVSDPTSL
jgi:hypothetical protein